MACSKSAQQLTTEGNTGAIKTMLCFCHQNSYSYSPFNFLKPMIDTFIPCVYASIETSEWVIGEGASLELAKQSAKTACEKKGKNTYFGDCYEGTFAVDCSCQKIVSRKDPTKIGLKTLNGFGSAYTEKEATAKAETNCINSHSGGVEIYDKSKFKPPFK